MLWATGNGYSGEMSGWQRLSPSFPTPPSLDAGALGSQPRLSCVEQPTFTDNYPLMISQEGLIQIIPWTSFLWMMPMRGKTTALGLTNHCQNVAVRNIICLGPEVSWLLEDSQKHLILTHQPPSAPWNIVLFALFIMALVHRKHLKKIYTISIGLETKILKYIKTSLS